MEIPRKLDHADVCLVAHVSGNARHTGRTRHFIGGSLLGPVAHLAICQYGESDGYYLFYCDENWKVLTDTFHQTIDDARGQAEFEYEGISNLWVPAS